MPLSPRFVKGVRVAHLYLGVFVAPAVLFFSITGAIQTFSLHETTRGSSYEPPRILVILAQIHKKQTPVIQEKKPQPPAKPAADRSARNPDGHSPAEPLLDPATAPSRRAPSPPGVASTASPESRHNPLPLKIFFLLVAISLTLSTLTGLSMAYAYNRNKAAISTLLILGTVVPALMVLL